MISKKMLQLVPCLVVTAALGAGCGSGSTPATTGTGGSGSGGSGSGGSGSGGAGTGGSNGNGGVVGSGGSVPGTGGRQGTGGSNVGGTTSTVGSGGSPGTGGDKPDGAAGSGGTAGVAGTTVAAGGAAGAKTGGAIAGNTGTAGTPGGAGGGTSVGGTEGGCATVSDFATWPSGKGPSDLGKLAVNNFKPHTGDAYTGAGYAWTFSYFGSLQFTKLAGDKTNNDYLISKFDCSQAGPSNTSTASVDDRAFGDLPLEIFIENQDAACKKLGLDRADTQWASTTSDGITKDARYWIDDMYMITGLQMFAYRATKDTKYMDRAAKTMQAYVAALQQTDGLFWHTKQSKAYWGRANGWVASGMTELLLDLPAGATRDAIMAAYKKQMDGLLPLQITSGTDAGCWRQVLNLTSANAESSCTAMFTFALVTGARNGWLTDAKYAKAAHDGWIALGNKTSSSGQVDKVCPGTGQAPAGDLSSQQQFYATIALGSNDQHGQAPLLWSANALIRPDCPGVR